MSYSASTTAWVDAMQSNGLIDNWCTPIELMNLNQESIPIGIGRFCPNQTYLSSAKHGYIDYARDELDQIENESTRKWSSRLLNLIEPWFAMLKLDESVSVNAWGVSTHLYPQWTVSELDELQHKLIVDHPDRLFWIRTLHEELDQDLMASLANQGWQFWPSRVVYGFDWQTAPTWLKQRNTQIDQKLLVKTPLQSLFPDDFTADHAKMMERLYRQLYLEKHSHWNAHYTQAYFEQAIQHKWLSFYGFANEEGELVAFIGVFENERVMTTPMLGYDTSLPQQLGLYRLLMARVLKVGVDHSKYVNFGAGSANFKRMRGGVASVEWHAFYVNHLPRARRFSLSLTGNIMRRVLPSFLAKQAV